MSVRRLLVGGNWKCNNTLKQSLKLVNNVVNKMKFDPKKVGTNPFSSSRPSYPPF